MKLKLISCEVFFREMWHVAARSPHKIDLEFLPQGIHNRGGAAMRTAIQEAIDSVPAQDYDSILLGYGLCNNGLDSIVARSIPLVVPRAHDCITLFFGSSEKYIEFFNEHPGTYFKTSGWIERATDEDGTQLALQPFADVVKEFNSLTEKYGEDNARYIIESLHTYKIKYNRLAYIEMGIEPDDRFERESREIAERSGWTFEKIRGDLTLFRNMVNGDWNEKEFLIVSPGSKVKAIYTDVIITSEPIDV
jgi:hypothetical protein